MPQAYSTRPQAYGIADVGTVSNTTCWNFTP